MTGTEKHPGLRRFLGIIEERFTQKPSKQPGRTAKSKNGQTQTLRQVMEEHTKFVITEKIKPHQILFLLDEAQLNTLNQLPITQRAKDLAESLNGLAYIQVHSHEAMQALKTIRTCPSSSETESPNWTEWWINERYNFIGVHRWNDQLKHDDERELRKIIVAMWRAAMPQMPTYQALAQATPKAKGLGEVMVAKEAVLSLADKMGVDQETLLETPADRVNPKDSPETILLYLQAGGLNLKRDMGTVTPDLKALKNDLQGRTTKEIRTLVDRNGSTVWYAKDIQNSHHLPVNHNHVTPPPQEPSEGRPPLTAGPNEKHLIMLTTIAHPQKGYMHGLNEEAFQIGWAAGHTPQAVESLLDNPLATEPSPIPTPEICPEAGICPALCAMHQRTGFSAHPLTPDWSHQSCRYWQFLTIHKDSPPAIREAVAGEIRDRIIGDFNKKPARRNAPEPALEWDEDEENPPLQDNTKSETFQKSLF